MINNKTIYHIITTVGQTFHEVTINYHSDYPNSSIMFKEKEEDTFKSLLPTSSILWSTKDVVNADENDSFSTHERYVCSLELKDLKENTKYEYFIKNEHEESNLYSFTTECKNKAKILAFCDFQHPYQAITHNLIKKLKNIAPDSAYLLCSGDLTGAGAIEDEWTWVIDEDNSFNEYICAFAPGDHEYWGETFKAGVPMMKEANPYNHLFNNPKNGCPTSINSSYYFIRDNTLFITLDMGDSNTNFGERLEEEVKWFKEVIKSLKGTYKHLIVIEHKSLYGSTEIDRGVTKYIKPMWINVFDDAGVDLVISGHDHLYSRTYMLKNNKVSNNGTYYLDLGSSGTKRRALDGSTNDELHEKIIDIKNNEFALGAIISIDDNSLSVEVYNQDGILLDKFSK